MTKFFYVVFCSTLRSDSGTENYTTNLSSSFRSDYHLKQKIFKTSDNSDANRDNSPMDRIHIFLCNIHSVLLLYDVYIRSIND